MRIFKVARRWAQRIKGDVMLLWFARNHPKTPMHAKLLAMFVVAYALSPIDLIPDFIPVLGYLDDVLILPLFIWLAVRMLPEEALEDSREKAMLWKERMPSKPRLIAGAAIVISVWLAFTGWFMYWFIRHFLPS